MGRRFKRVCTALYSLNEAEGTGPFRGWIVSRFQHSYVILDKLIYVLWASVSFSLLCVIKVKITTCWC